jgi:hypothetical protein
MKKYYWKIIYLTLALLFSVFMFIYGGYDDSPGAQLLGLIIFIISIIGLVRIRKKHYSIKR